MTVYVDNLQNYPSEMMDRQTLRNGTEWCHLYTDSKDLSELHDIASKIGMRRKWFQDRPGFPHYDLTPRRRPAAIKAGAVVLSLRDYLLAKQKRLEENGT